jgi:hypothetical protein
MHRDHKVEHGTNKKYPAAQITVRVQSGEEKDASGYKDRSPQFVDDRVYGLPAELPFKVLPVPGQIMQTAPVGENMGHGLPLSWPNADRQGLYSV